jgi:hypothetical protein
MQLRRSNKLDRDRESDDDDDNDDLYATDMLGGGGGKIRIQTTSNNIAVLYFSYLLQIYDTRMHDNKLFLLICWWHC